MTQKEEVFNKLEIIKKEYGIEIIKEFIKRETKKSNKKSGRPASGITTATRVYFKMFGLEYEKKEDIIKFVENDIKIKITTAKEKIAEENGTTDKVVDRHITNFNKLSDKLDYEDFCKHFEAEARTQHSRSNDYSDFEIMEYVLTDFSNERKIVNNGMIEDFGDYRYTDIDIRQAIAFYLRYKYNRIKKTNHKNFNKREDFIPPIDYGEDVPF